MHELREPWFHAGYNDSGSKYLRYGLVAAWHFMRCRPGMIPHAIICTPRYVALVALHLLPSSNGSHMKYLLVVEVRNM